MKRFFALVFTLSLISTSAVFGQFLDLNIPSGELPSDISAWSNDPKLMTISFAVPDGIKIDNGHIVFEVTAGPEQILFSTMSRFSEQPSVTGTFKKKNFTFKSIVNDAAIEMDTSPKSLIGQQGKLPAGFFGLCFYLVDSAGKPAKDIFQGCTNFFVRDIDPPALLSPPNESAASFHTPLLFS